ncbi:hypothetical protein TrVE_jg14010 [Triparma verrucosa]|uniref:Uncharacterized protein n=1 Tax=Triparma verrucosa TaxID=1606542 RepID=A0A9W7KUE9_9STRA|nr:hypothetical protein TrVE_jg14010 [Triparma verrucosa]
MNDVGSIESQILEFRRLLTTTTDEEKQKGMIDAIESLEVKLKTMGEGQEEIPQLSITPDLSPGKSLISAVGPSHSRPMSARPMSARRRSEPNLGIIPEEWKRKGGGGGKEGGGGGGRVPRSSIKLSERGKVLDIVSLLDEEEKSGGEEGKNESKDPADGMLGENLANRSIVMDMGGGGRGGGRMFSPGGGGGAPKGRRKSSPEEGLGVPITPLHLGNLDKHIASSGFTVGVDDSGYSSSESVSSVSSDISITRKKKRDKRLTTGGLDDVIEESVGSVSAREEVGGGENAFGGEVCELSPNLVASCCASSGDLGHNHNLRSSWIPTGLFPQFLVITFTRSIDISKLTVDCSGARKLSLKINDTRYESPELPPTSFLTISARHTSRPNVDILDTPRSSRGGGGGAGTSIKKFWSAGHLGPQHSPSPGVIKPHLESTWSSHTFSPDSCVSRNVKTLTLTVESGHVDDAFVVVSNVRILGKAEKKKSFRGKGTSLSSRIGEAVGR